MNKKIYITGVGVICALGNNKEEVRTSILKSKPGVTMLEHVNTKYKDVFPCGEIKLADSELSQMAGLPEGTLNRTSLLGLIAARQAIEGFELPNPHYKVGLFSATTVGGMDLTEQHYADFLDDKETVDFIQKNDCGYVTEKIAEELGICSFFTTTTTACSSSINSIILGANMIRNGMLDAAIVGGTDALSKFTINGFNSLQLLAKEVCRPFDDTRNGINLGEGAAFFLIESEASLEKTGSTPIAVLSGYGNANDAYHLSAVSPKGHGISLSMEKAIDKAGLASADIDFIITHGTATKNNDAGEASAIVESFGAQSPDFCSLKSTIGHTLGSAGAINTAFGLIALETKSKFANLNYRNPMKEVDIRPVAQLQRDQALEHVLVNSVGMGGFCSSLIVSNL